MDKIVRILIIGDWCWPQYAAAFAAGLQELGHEVLKFSVSPYFNGFLGKYQSALPVPGPVLFRQNRDLLRFLQAESPDLMLAWRCTHLLPATIERTNALGVVTISYNNDDPFGPKAHGQVPWHHHFLWYWYLKTLKYYKFNFFFRQQNLAEAKSYGARHAQVLMPYFIPWIDRPVTLDEEETRRFACDVTFVGHYEPDGRENYLRALVGAGLKVKLYGDSYWTRQVLGDLYDFFAPIVPAEGEDYAKALCGAKVCLAFLSKLNRDTYTSRCFEIPACGRAMLAERTDDLLKMFKEDEEACFFSSKEELVNKAKWLVENQDIREKIAQAGLRRVWADGHDVRSRAAQFIAMVSENPMRDHIKLG